MNLISFSGHTFDLERLLERPRVLDVGARNFVFSKAILEVRPSADVLALEPDPNVKNIPGVRRSIAALVGDGRHWVDYISLSTGEGNCVLDPWDKFRPDASTCRNIPACDIRDITDASKVEKWDLVKLDCEGSEFSILENWPRGGIAGQISVEFHDFKNPERWNKKYFEWLWTQLPDYEVIQHEYFKQGEAFGFWDSLLVRKEGI